MEKDAAYRAILSIISAAVAMHTNITVAVIVKVAILITLLSFFLKLNLIYRSLSLAGVILNLCYPEKILILKN